MFAYLYQLNSMQKRAVWYNQGQSSEWICILMTVYWFKITSALWESGLSSVHLQSFWLLLLQSYSSVDWIITSMREQLFTPHRQHERTHILCKGHGTSSKVKNRKHSLQRHQFAVAQQYLCKGLSTFLFNGIVLEADEWLEKLNNYSNYGSHWHIAG